ncbi:hypothetical protein RKD29_007847 [Streptomyces tendae]
MDLLNSRPAVNGEERDTLGDPTEGRRWAREHGGEGCLAELALLRETRDALQDAVCGDTSPAVLTPLLESVHMAVCGNREKARRHYERTRC